MEPDRKSIEEGLDRILSSEDFCTKPIMKKLLQHLVTESLEGRSDQINGYTVGLEVFGGGVDFDPDRGALVRNNAARLRSLLKTFYLGEGSNDPLSIEIPRGTYVPQFLCKDNGSNSVDGISAQVSRSFDGALAPVIVVMPFVNNTSDTKLDYLASGFSRELTDALTKFAFRVIGLDGVIARLQDDADFLISGDVASSGGQVKIRFILRNAEDNSQLWSDSIRFDLNNDDLFDVQEEVTGRIASLIGGEFGRINQHRYQVMLASRPQSVTEQDMLLKHYHHVLVLTDESVNEFHRDVMQAHEAHPESALLTSLASSIYNNIWMFSGSGDDESLREFARLAEKAYQLNPNHQDVLSNLAGKCFHFGERERFFALFDHSKEWMANSPLRLGSWAMYMCFFGEWELGKKLIDRVLENNIYVPLWLHGVTCAYHINRRDYDAALSEANKYQIPGLFWAPAYRCSIFGQLGLLDEAKKELDALFECRPDFVENGRWLISRLHKEEQLLDHIFDGLDKAGLSLA